MLKTEALQDFIRAVEEAKEVIDRRAGRQPTTTHGAIDFLSESIEYVDVDAMNLLERIGWLPDSARLLMPAETVAASLRATARAPHAALQAPARVEVGRHGLTAEEQLLTWWRFDRMPADAQRKLLPKGCPGVLCYFHPLHY